MHIETMDEYIETFPAEVQRILEGIRRTIRKAVPDAVEAISYQIPTFKLDDRNIIHFAAYKKHIGFYPAPSGPKDFEKRIAPYRSGKSTIRFPLKDSIPQDLVRKIVELQIKETNKR